jgi:hypothetical protein
MGCAFGRSIYATARTSTNRIWEALAELELQEVPNSKRMVEGYNFHRTTLLRYHRSIYGSIKKARESQCLLLSQQQIVLVNYINKLSKAGIPLTSMMVCIFAFEICQKWPGEQ